MSTEPEQEVKKSPTEYGLVMNGGGVKGLAFVGALKELEARTEVTFDTFGGTSAGSIAATILAMGYSATEMEGILRGLAFDAFLNKKWQPNERDAPWEPKKRPTPSALWKIVRLLFKLVAFPFRALIFPFRMLALWIPVLRGSVYSTEPVGGFLQHLAKWRKIHGKHPKEPRNEVGTTFKQLLPNRLMVLASSTGNQQLKIFESRVTPGETVEFAVRASMAIPGFFEPQSTGNEVFFDGGLVANFAFKEFENLYSDRRALGLYLYDGDDRKRTAGGRFGLGTLLKRLMMVWLGQDEGRLLQESSRQIIQIDTSPIETIDFSLKDEDKELLLLSGKLAVVSFLVEYQQAPPLPLKAGGAPSEAEHQALVDEVKGLREKARKRWARPHFARRLELVAFLLTPFLVAGLVIWFFMFRSGPPPSCTSNEVKIAVLDSLVDAPTTLDSDVTQISLDGKNVVQATADDFSYTWMVGQDLVALFRRYRFADYPASSEFVVRTRPTLASGSQTILFSVDAEGQWHFIVPSSPAGSQSILAGSHGLDVVAVTVYFERVRRNFLLMDADRFSGHSRFTFDVLMDNADVGWPAPTLYTTRCHKTDGTQCSLPEACFADHALSQSKGIGQNVMTLANLLQAAYLRDQSSIDDYLRKQEVTIGQRSFAEATASFYRKPMEIMSNDVVDFSPAASVGNEMDAIFFYSRK